MPRLLGGAPGTALGSTSCRGAERLEETAEVWHREEHLHERADVARRALVCEADSGCRAGPLAAAVAARASAAHAIVAAHAAAPAVRAAAAAFASAGKVVAAATASAAAAFAAASAAFAAASAGAATAVDAAVTTLVSAAAVEAAVARDGFLCQLKQVGERVVLVASKAFVEDRSDRFAVQTAVQRIE